MLKLIPLVLALGSFGSAILAAEAKTETPRPLAHNEAGIHKLAPAFTGTTHDGKPFKVRDFATGKKAVVVAVTSTSCPLSKKYLPTLAQLEKDFAAKGVGFVFVNPIATDDAESVTRAAKTVQGPYLLDKDGSLCQSLGITTTTEVLVLDARRTVIYRGAVDDQYGIGYSKESPKLNYLHDAIEATLAGKWPACRATTAPGCELDLSKAKAPAAAKVTYHNFISRLIQQNCLDCHRSGGSGPFTLEKPEELMAHKGAIKKVLARGIMPPWFAAKPPAGKHSPFLNDPTLPAADQAALLAWFEAGGPLGDEADAPLSRTFPKDWAIGKPDAIFELPKAVEIKATGIMPYYNFVVETNFKEDRWMKGYEIRPTEPGVVHHVVIYLLTRPKPLFEFLDRPQGAEALSFLAAYVPGNTTQMLPAGFATKIPKNSRLLFQLHYTPNGTATKDQTRFGVVLSDKPPTTELKVSSATDPRELEIPPEAENHPVVVTMPKFKDDRVILGMSPHMHLRGKACRYEAILPDKTVKLLMDVPAYDFNWQLQYRLAEPVTLPSGTRLRFTAWYDNSSKNPANPDPKATVRWGQQTHEEMNIGYYFYYTK